jgi:hypothetical protein
MRRTRNYIPLKGINNVNSEARYIVHIQLYCRYSKFEDGRIILRWIFRKLGGGGRGEWMELAQDRERWRALVGTVRDFLVP